MVRDQYSEGSSDAPDEVLDLRELASEARIGDEPLVRTYVLTLERGRERSVARVGGPPIGVSEQTRPRYEGAWMQHLITLDLDAIPELRAHEALTRARAVALFISDAADNDAFDENTAETAVVILADEDIARGEWRGDPVVDPRGAALAAWPVDVPARVFALGLDEPDDDDPIRVLEAELMSACRAGGAVIFWSGDEPREDFLFQFNESLVDVNLGDGGTMYVFERSAHWQGH